jgi:hypothetical protein
VCEPQLRKRGRPPTFPYEPHLLSARPTRRAREQPVNYTEPADEPVGSELEGDEAAPPPMRRGKIGGGGGKRRRTPPPTARHSSASGAAQGSAGGLYASGLADDPETLAAVPAPTPLMRLDSGPRLGDGTHAIMAAFFKLQARDGLDAERTRAVLRSWGLMSARYQHSHFTTVLSNLAKAVALDLETLLRRPSPRATATPSPRSTNSNSHASDAAATSALQQAFQPDKMEAYLREMFGAPYACCVQIGVS